MIPIFSGLEDDAAAAAVVDGVDVELLLLLVLLLLPQAAIHSPHSPITGMTASRRSDHRLLSLSNLVTS
jgi:hypothetical protein